MLFAVIMAGGAGTRFWPASRSALPKQLLNLVGDRSMVQETAARLGELVPAQRQLVVTNRSLVPAMTQQLPELPPESIIGEPCKRDTAPCVGLAAALIQQQDDDATLVVLPADHVIRPAEDFRRAIHVAASMVEQQPQRIVTFGIRPTYPAESFGYIERDNDPPAGNQTEYAEKVYRVRRFHEKPTAEVAARYLSAGNYYWNSGIFVWKARTILAALRDFEPAMFAHLEAIAAAIGQPDFVTTLDREFAAIEGKSIDYAVMERYQDVVVIEAPFEWDDLGSWQSLARLRGCDSEGNTIVGRHLGVGTRGSIVRSSDQHLVVTLGMEDCIIVHTPDATLVARKDDEESIRKIVSQIREQGWDEYL